MLSRKYLAAATAASVLAIPTLAHAAEPIDGSQVAAEDMDLQASPSDAITNLLDGAQLAAGDQVDIQRLAQGIYGILERGSSDGKLLDLDSGGSANIDPALFQALEGVAPPLKSLRNIINTISPSLDRLKMLIEDSDGSSSIGSSDLGNLLGSSKGSSDLSNLLDDGTGSNSKGSSDLITQIKRIVDRHAQDQAAPSSAPKSDKGMDDARPGTGDDDKKPSGNDEKFTPIDINIDDREKADEFLDQLRKISNEMNGDTSGKGSDYESEGKDDEGSATLDTQGLAPGEYTVTGEITDKDGNTRPAEVTFTIKDKDDKDKDDSGKESGSDKKDNGSSNSESDKKDDNSSNSESGSGKSDSDGDTDSSSTKKDDNSSNSTGGGMDAARPGANDSQVDAHAEKPEKRVTSSAAPTTSNNNAAKSVQNANEGAKRNAEAASGSGNSNATPGGMDAARPGENQSNNAGRSNGTSTNNQAGANNQTRTVDNTNHNAQNGQPTNPNDPNQPTEQPANNAAASNESLPVTGAGVGKIVLGVVGLLAIGGAALFINYRRNQNVG